MGAGPIGAALPWSPGDALSFGWNRLKADPVTIVVGIFVAILVGAIPGIISGFASGIYIGLAQASSHGHSINPFADPIYLTIRGVGTLLNLITQYLMMGGLFTLALKVARGQPASIGDVFSGMRFTLPIIGAQFLTFVIVFFASLLLFVPGIIAGLGLSLSIMLIVDKNLGPIAAMQESWRVTDGQKVNLFLMHLLGFVVLMAGMCLCFVGIFAALPVYFIALAYVYLRITGQQTAEVQL